MKKGCFFTVIVGLTFTIGVGSYLYKKFSPELKKYGKEKILEFSTKEIDRKINELAATKYRDSIRVLFKNELEKVKEYDFKKNISEELNSLVTKFEDFSKDEIIDSLEFIKLKKIVDSDERPKKN